jgi:mannose-6-phosphate isomerase-like protein (cupin superfamily)
MSKPYEIHDLSEYLTAPASEYYDWLVQSKEIGAHPELGAVVPIMRDLIPAEGKMRESRKILHHGKHVSAHKHVEWVALFYIDPGNPPLPVIIDGERVQPKAGDCVVMPPGVPHYTEAYKGKSPRILTAVMVDERRAA